MQSFKNMIKLLEEGTIIPMVISPDNLLKNISPDFYTSGKEMILQTIKNKEIFGGLGQKIGQGGMGSVYNIGDNHVLKITAHCGIVNPHSHIVQLCEMAENGDIIFRIPSTLLHKEIIFCPNYISEPIIGAILDRFKGYTPSFMKLYGYLYDRNSPEKKTYQIMEKLVSKSYSSIDDFFYMLFQILFALNAGQQLARFTHWDLWEDNVMMRKKSPQKIQKYQLGNSKFLYSRCDMDAVIIDYGHSRCETNDYIITPRAIFGPSVVRDSLDYYGFNPFPDVFTIIYRFLVNSDEPSAINNLFEILKFFLNVPLDYSNDTLIKNIQDNILTQPNGWRPSPEKLTFNSLPKRALEVANFIADNFPTTNASDYKELDSMFSDENKVVVSSNDISLENDGEEFYLPSDEQSMDTSFYPYLPITKDSERLYFYKIGPVPFKDIRPFKPYNLTVPNQATHYKEQYITVAIMTQPSKNGGKGKFRSDCCRMDVRTFFQTNLIKEGIAINASFFMNEKLRNDYTPVGLYKSQNFLINNPLPKRYENWYRCIVIQDGELNIVSVDDAFQNIDSYTDITTCGPILIENGEIIMTESELKTAHLDMSNGKYYKDLQCREPQTYEEASEKIFQDGVTNCRYIKPGELGHASNINPRSAIALDNMGNVFFVCVEGRETRGGSTGYDLSDLSLFIRDKLFDDDRKADGFRIITALNMDGGTSSVMTHKINNIIEISKSEQMNAFPVGSILSYIVDLD
jgi:hypothetical protein